MREDPDSPAPGACRWGRGFRWDGKIKQEVGGWRFGFQVDQMFVKNWRTDCLTPEMNHSTHRGSVGRTGGSGGGEWPRRWVAGMGRNHAEGGEEDGVWVRGRRAARGRAFRLWASF